MIKTIADAILGSEDIRSQDQYIEEWGLTVRVTGLNDAQASSYQAKTRAIRMKQHQGQVGDVEVAVREQRAELLVQVLRDPETGQRIFDDNQARKLAQKNAGIIQALYSLAENLSDLDKDFKELIKDAEEDFSSGQK